MGIKQRIAGVVVTYNRKHLLKRCLEALSSQNFKPQVVFIVDNASTDGTMESVQEWGFYNCFNNGIEYRYIRNSHNEGGAGGFHIGIKTAYESDADGVWVMDDDGQPEKQCLAELVKHLGDNDYLAPIVLSDEDHKSCSFAPDFEEKETFIGKQEVHEGLIKDWASPFNGILYSHKLIEKIGFPKREMFIWGDEQNYHLRAVRAGMPPVTVVDAIHYHPLDRQEKIDYKGYKLTIANSDWKQYCYLRNSWYNRIHVTGRPITGLFANIHSLSIYHSYYCKEKKTRKFSLLMDAYVSAVFGRFSGLKKYMK